MFRSRAPEALGPILQRLAIEPHEWCQHVGEFDRLFYNVAGRPQTIDGTVSRLTRQRYHVRVRAREIFAKLPDNDNGTDSITRTNGQLPTENESDTDTRSGSDDLEDNDTATMQLTQSFVDPETGLQISATTNDTNGDEAQFDETLQQTDVHANGGDTLSGTDHQTGHETSHDLNRSTASQQGTDADGNVLNVQIGSTSDANDTNNLTDDAGLNTNGSASDTSSTTDSFDRHETSIKTGSVTTPDSATTLNNTVSLGQHHDETDTDTQTTTAAGATTDTPTANSDDTYTLNLSVHETLALMNPDGTMAPPVNIDTGGSGSVTLVNGQLPGSSNAAPSSANTPDFFDQMLGTLSSAISLQNSFSYGVAVGFAYDGAWGTVQSIISAPSTIWSGIRGAASFVCNNPGTAAAGALAFSPLGMPIVGSQVGVGLATRQEMRNSLTPDTWAKIFNGDFDSLRGKIDPTLLLAAEVIRPVLRGIVNDISQAFSNLTPEKAAEMAGRVVGMILYEVAEGIALNAASAALKSAKLLKLKSAISAALGSNPTIAKRIADRLDTVSDTVKCLSKGACFAAGTQILTPKGSQSVESLQSGDWVLARSEYDPTAPVTPRRIERVFQQQAVLMELHVGGQIVRTTAEHPFYVDGIGWRSANELAEGDQILGHDQQKTMVRRIVLTHDVATVYNMRVSVDHTYFVGCEEWGFSLWAHNLYEVEALPGGAFRIKDAAGAKVISRGELDDLVKKGLVNADDANTAIQAGRKMASPNSGYPGPPVSPKGKQPELVDLSKLRNPPSKPVADPAKLARHKAFDPKKADPIIVEIVGKSKKLEIVEGVTRAENARRAGFTTIWAYVFERK